MSELKLSDADREAVRKLFTARGDALSILFLEELAFVVLPLAVIAVIRIVLNAKIVDFFALPEWSFGSTVLSASVLRRFIDLKSRVQMDQSKKVLYGSRFAVLLIVASVIMLALSVIGQVGINVNLVCIGVGQVALFLFVTLFLYCVIVGQEIYSHDAVFLKHIAEWSRLQDRLVDHLRRAQRVLIEASALSEHLAQMQCGDAESRECEIRCKLTNQRLRDLKETIGNLASAIQIPEGYSTYRRQNTDGVA